MKENAQTQGDDYRGINRILKSQALKILFERFSDGTYTDFIDDWKWIFSYSARYRKAIVFYTVLGIASSTLSLASSVISKYLIDIITGYQYSSLWILLIFMVTSTVFSLILKNVVGRVSLKISIDVNNDIQKDIFVKIMDADWIKISTYQNGDLLNRFHSDVKTISGNAISWIPDLIVNLYSFLAAFFLILYYDAVMALFCFVSAPILLLVSRRVMRRLREYQKRVLEINSGMMSFETETFYNFDTIKSFGVTESYIGKLQKWQKIFRDCNLDYNLYSIKMNVGMSGLNAGVGMAIFVYCLFLMWNGSITYGTMTLFLAQSNKLATGFNTLISTVPSMINSAVSAHRVREVAEIPGEVHNMNALESLKSLAEDGFSVHMKNIGFSYQEDKTVIADSNFVANPGEIVALVGPSGEGKTTMLRLFLGLIHPWQGEVFLMASDRTEVAMNADLRQFFSYVPQGNTLISGTIEENMRMVKPEATEKEIEEALKTACAWKFVSRLEGGIHFRLGERGRGVSEGQAQRLAIARAILRDAPILLLDEATSALDIDTEKKVLQNIIRKRPNKTCIISTHRPGVLSMCQRVYRVKEYKITEIDNKCQEL